MQKNLLLSAFSLLMSILIISVTVIWDYHKSNSEQEELYDSLAETVSENEASDDECETSEESIIETSNISTTDTHIEMPQVKQIIPEYEELYEQNHDIVGWISIADTKINYPVMQSINEPNFYLNHSFDKTPSNYGCPYVQENCDVQKPSDNIVIHGHHLKNGSMFTDLMKFKDKEFWEEHRRITFNTLTERNEYEVIAVFKTVVYTGMEDEFKYFLFSDAEISEQFDEYVSKCKELSLYDTGISAKYGDKLITLSTCEYSSSNGRLVVVAKRI